MFRSVRNICKRFISGRKSGLRLRSSAH